MAMVASMSPRACTQTYSVAWPRLSPTRPTWVAALPARPGRVEIACTHFSQNLGALEHDAAAGAVRHGVRGHGGAHHDRPAVAVLRHEPGCQRDRGGGAGVCVLGRPAGRGPAVGS